MSGFLNKIKMQLEVRSFNLTRKVAVNTSMHKKTV